MGDNSTRLWPPRPGLHLLCLANVPWQCWVSHSLDARMIVPHAPHSLLSEHQDLCQCPWSGPSSRTDKDPCKEITMRSCLHEGRNSYCTTCGSWSVVCTLFSQEKSKPTKCGNICCEGSCRITGWLRLSMSSGVFNIGDKRSRVLTVNLGTATRNCRCRKICANQNPASFSLWLNSFGTLHTLVEGCLLFTGAF
jgi:hypothetical protein